MAGFADSESVDTSGMVAGFGGPRSVDTSGVVAGFGGGHTRGWPPAPHRDPRRLQIHARGVAMNGGGGLYAPQRPPESPQRQDLLLFVVAQDIAHDGDGTAVPRRRQRLGCYGGWWPVFRCPSVAGFGCPPRLMKNRHPFQLARSLRPVPSAPRVREEVPLRTV